MIKAVIFDFYGVLVSLDTGKPNTYLFDYIKTNLKDKYKLGIISNANGEGIFKLISDDDNKLFDSKIVSAVFGHAKPDPLIYQEAAKRLGVEPSKCIYIDDITEYTEAAQKLGMRGITYKTYDQTILDLEKILSPNSNN